MRFGLKSKKPTANARGIGCLAQLAAYGIIVFVVLFSDVMFVSLLWNAFPGGFMTIAAVGGAFATGMSVIALAVGKSHWFRPGPQLVFSWLFTGVEVLVSVMNVVVSVAVAHHNALGYLSYYVLIAPATPLVALVGWIVILNLDTASTQRHAQMEMEDEKHQAELDYQKAEHEAHMQLKHGFLEQFESFLQEETNSSENLAILRQAAARLGKSVISGLIGSPIAMNGSQFVTPEPQTPPALPVPQSLSQQAVTGVTSEFRALPAIDNPQKMLDLLDMAVQYGLMTEEEARPLRQALKASATSQSKNGH